MSEAQKEILKMLSDNVITVDEAERLLKALNEGEKQKNESTKFNRRTRKDDWIAWSNDAAKILNLIRAITRPYPGALTKINNKEVIVWQASLVNGANKNEKPGMVLGFDEEGNPIIGTGFGQISIKEMQFVDESKGEIKIPSLKVGDLLG